MCHRCQEKYKSDDDVCDSCRAEEANPPPLGMLCDEGHDLQGPWWLTEISGWCCICEECGQFVSYKYNKRAPYGR